MKRAAKVVLKEYGLTIGLAIGFALGVRIFLLEAYRIPGPSMRPTLEAGDTIFVSKWGFKGTSSNLRVRRGDIVVFSSTQPTPGEYIRRVVGLPGDWIEVKKGILFLNKIAMTSEPKKYPPCATERTPEGLAYDICIEGPPHEDLLPQKVPDQMVLVLSDFRTVTRELKKTKIPVLIPVGSIKGKARWIWLSVDPDSSAAGIFPRIRFERMFRRI